MYSHCLRDLFINFVPEIDFEKGYGYYLHNMENYSKALLATLKSIKSKIPILKTMLETEEYEGLRTITQTLRRMAFTIGCDRLAELSYELEYVLLNDEDELNDRLSDYLAALEDLADRMEELIKKLPVQHLIADQNKKGSYFDYDLTKTREMIDFTNGILGKKII